ncbi:MAG: response regulator transcription factor [Actinomycetota bacterium]|nr:response regulator transcription factor [Actinomycetota bacterium]
MVPTVLLVDDQAAFRTVARRLLEADGFHVIGEAADARSAVRAAGELAPDVVLLDVRLPDRSGLDSARLIRDVERPPVVVLISTADYAHAVNGCGAQGFIPKGQLSGARLRAALEAVPDPGSDLS